MMPQGQGFRSSAVQHVQIESADLRDSRDSSDISHRLAIVESTNPDGPTSTAETHTSTANYKVSPSSSKHTPAHHYNEHYLCAACDTAFPNDAELSHHVCFKKPNVNVFYQCQECNFLLDSLPLLAEHIRGHNQNVLVVKREPPPRPSVTRIVYRCSVCDKYLSSKGSLMKHQHLHMGLRPFTCQFCSKTFSLKGNRDKHQLIHTGERPHRCEICSKTFTLKGNLQHHILTHTSLKMYKCTQCDSEFTLKGNLTKHLIRHKEGMGKTGRRKLSKVSVNIETDVDENVNTCVDENQDVGKIVNSDSEDDDDVDENVFGVNVEDQAGNKTDVNDAGKHKAPSESSEKMSETESVTVEAEIQNC